MFDKAICFSRGSASFIKNISSSVNSTRVSNEIISFVSLFLPRPSSCHIASLLCPSTATQFSQFFLFHSGRNQIKSPFPLFPLFFLLLLSPGAFLCCRAQTQLKIGPKSFPPSALLTHLQDGHYFLTDDDEEACNSSSIL